MRVATAFVGPRAKTIFPGRRRAERAANTHPAAGSTSHEAAPKAGRDSVPGPVNPARRRLLPFLLPLLLGAGAGCSDPPPQPDAAVDVPRYDGAPIVDPTLDLGTGQSAWEPLADGSNVELIHGPQGGYHLFARIRQQQLGADVQVTFNVTPVAGGAPVNDPTDRIRLLEGRGLVRTSQGWETSSALLVILVTIRAPAEVVGRRFTLEATVSPTGSGSSATVRRTITIVDET